MANKKQSKTKQKEPAKKFPPAASPWCCQLLRPLILVENLTGKAVQHSQAGFFFVCFVLL